MAGTGTLQVTFNVTNLPVGSESFSSTTTASTAIVFASTVSLSSGANTITIPTGITTLVVVGPNGVSPTPNPAYAGTLTLKGVTGDTGVPISAKWPLVLEWDTTTIAPSTIVINATVATTAYLWGM